MIYLIVSYTVLVIDSTTFAAVAFLVWFAMTTTTSPRRTASPVELQSHQEFLNSLLTPFIVPIVVLNIQRCSLHLYVLRFFPCLFPASNTRCLKLILVQSLSAHDNAFGLFCSGRLDMVRRALLFLQSFYRPALLSISTNW